MGQRRIDPQEVFLHLAVVFGVLGGLALLLRLVVPAFVLLGLAVGVGVLSRRPEPDHPAPPPVGPVIQDALESRTAPQASIDRIPHLPPAPPATTLDPWAPCTVTARVISGATHAQARRRMSDELRVHRQAVLVPDPEHPDLPHTVAVFVGDEHIGDLGSPDALAYAAVLGELATRGAALAVPIEDGLGAVRLPPPEGAEAANTVPRGSFVTLPHGGPMKVRQEPDHPEELLAVLRPGVDVWVAVTLHADGDDMRVDLDGHPVGRLAPIDAESMLPLVRFCASRRLTPVAAATVRGSSLLAQVTLFCLTAQDADELWLRSLGPEVP